MGYVSIIYTYWWLRTPIKQGDSINLVIYYGTGYHEWTPYKMGVCFGLSRNLNYVYLTKSYFCITYINTCGFTLQADGNLQILNTEEIVLLVLDIFQNKCIQLLGMVYYSKGKLTIC